MGMGGRGGLSAAYGNWSDYYQAGAFFTSTGVYDQSYLNQLNHTINYQKVLDFHIRTTIEYDTWRGYGNWKRQIGEYIPGSVTEDGSGNTVISAGEVGFSDVWVPYRQKQAESSGWLDYVQTGLDLVGLVPVFGEAADGINALIYLGRGDYANAALSTAAMAPIAGWAATGIKLGGKAVKAAKTAGNLAKTPVGRSGNVLNVITKNSPTTINGTKFTGHALDQMQARGILSPSAVLDVIKNPARILPGNTPGTTVFIRDNLKIITNQVGDIITVIPH